MAEEIISLNDEFNDYSERVKNAKNVSDESKLELYKYYKQATIGDINTDKPGFLNFVAKAKWDSWNEIKGTSKEEAMNLYIKKSKELLSN